MPTPDSEFLKPTLDARDNASGFRRPYHPQWVAIVGFIGGSVLSSALLYSNHVRLGGSSRGAGLWAAICFFVVLPVRLIFGAWGSAVLAVVMVRSLAVHGRRHRIYESTASKVRSPGLLGIGLVVLGYILERLALAALFIGSVEVFGGPAVFDFMELMGNDVSEARVLYEAQDLQQGDSDQ